MFILWIVLIIGAVWFFTDGFAGQKSFRRSDHRYDDKYMEGHYEQKERPEDLARKRLAKGEITKAEFQDIMDTLRNN